MIAPKTTDADLSVVVLAASEAIPVFVVATKTEVVLCLAEQTWVDPRNIVRIKVYSEGTLILYFELKQNVARRERLIPAKCFIELCRNVFVDTIVTNLANITVNVPRHMVLCSCSNIMVITIDPEQVEKGTYTTATVHNDSKPPV